MSVIEAYRELLMKACFSAMALIGVGLLCRLLFASLRDELRRMVRIGVCGWLIVLLGLAIAAEYSANKSNSSPNCAGVAMHAPLATPSLLRDVPTDDGAADDEPMLAFNSIAVDSDSVRLGVAVNPSARFVNNVIYLGATSNPHSQGWDLLKEIQVSEGATNATVCVLKSEYPASLDEDCVLFTLEGEVDDSDPMSDEDGDGVTDADEQSYGSNPRLADSDGDGLDDLEEIVLGTDPTNADSDGDGVSDGDEVLAGTNPIFNVPPLEIPQGDHYELIGQNIYTTEELDAMPFALGEDPSNEQRATQVAEVVVPGITFHETSQMPIYHRTGSGMSIRALHTGRFKFKLLHADDIVNVRINGMTLTGDYYGDKPEASTILIAGRTYDIEVETWNRGGPARLGFEKFAEYEPIPRILMDAAFSKDAVIFEEPHRNSPSEFVPRCSTESVLRIALVGGSFGGKLYVDRMDDGKLTQGRLRDFKLDGEEVVPSTSPRIVQVGFQGQNNSIRCDDAEIRIRFVENETNEVIERIEKITSVKLMITADAVIPSNRRRHKVGVGEEVVIDYEPREFSLRLSTSDSTSNISGASGYAYRYTASQHACKDRISDSKLGEITVFNVLEPSGYIAKITDVVVTETHNIAGSFTANYKLIIEPTDVSFGNVQLKEVGGTATTPSGYFARPENSWLLVHGGGAVDTWVDVGEDNQSGDTVTCAELDGPWEDNSSMTWPIPNVWRVRPNLVSDCIEEHLWGNTDQKFTVDREGFVRVEKFSWYVQCDTNRCASVGIIR